MFICQSMSLFCFSYFFPFSPHFHCFLFLIKIYNIYILFFHSCLHHCFSRVCVWVCVLVAQSCLTLCDPMNCTLPVSSVHGIFQARILEWVIMPFSRGSSPSRDQTWVSCVAGRLFTVWATRETYVLALVLYLNIFNVHHQSFCSRLSSHFFVGWRLCLSRLHIRLIKSITFSVPCRLKIVFLILLTVCISEFIDIGQFPRYITTDIISSNICFSFLSSL